MVTLPEPSFIERDPEKSTAEMVALYEQPTGKTLYPAQPERIFIDVIAYRENLLRIQIQNAAVQNLVRFARNDMLDYLGDLVGCQRLSAQAALTTLRITLDAAQGEDLFIDAGYQRGSKDNKVVFATTASLTIPAGETTGDVAAMAMEAGIIGNGYLAGEVNQEIDVVAHVLAAVNIDTTTGGADVEEAEHYRERIMAAPESFSVAGPTGAYEFWAKSAHPHILDARCKKITPGVVNMYIHVAGGDPSQEILDAVSAVLSDEDIRPMCDEVEVEAATAVDYAIELDVVLYETCPDSSALAKAKLEAILTTYAAALSKKLGLDIVQDQIREQISGYPGIYKRTVVSPAADTVLDKNEWANCTGVTVNIVGRVNG